MLGHVVVAWIRLRQAMVALEKLRDAAGSERAFYEGKIAACRYFYRYELPQIETQCELLGAMDTTCLDTVAEAF